jgi:hypothetical protein
MSIEIAVLFRMWMCGWVQAQVCVGLGRCSWVWVACQYCFHLLASPTSSDTFIPASKTLLSTFLFFEQIPVYLNYISTSQNHLLLKNAKKAFIYKIKNVFNANHRTEEKINPLFSFPYQ